METVISRPDTRTALLDIMLDFGEELLSCGGEISRVEDSLVRMGGSYGAKKVNVFVITSSIVITVVFGDNDEITGTRRITKSVSTDLTRMERLNRLSRQCADGEISLEELKAKFEHITKSAPDKRVRYIGSLLAAGAFAVFFGGGIPDGLLAAAFAIIICLLQDGYAPLCPNKVFYYFTTSFVVGLGICAVSYISSALHMDKIMIGDIMLLIPGIAITTSVRDMLIGDTISGAMKFIESLLWAIAIAGGFMLAIALVGRVAL